MIKYIVFGTVIIIALFVGWNLIQKQSSVNQPQPLQSQQGHQEESGGYGMEKSFYSKDGIYLQHYWPGEGNFSNEETEILLFNESDLSLEVKSFDLVYSVEGKAYSLKSGTWEKFANKQSWDRIEYLNISPQYYKGEPLVLTAGQKGKLHWHIQFGSQPLDGKQIAHVKLILQKGSETITIDEQFKRDSGTVVSKEGH